MHSVIQYVHRLIHESVPALLVSSEDNLSTELIFRYMHTGTGTSIFIAWRTGAGYTFGAASGESYHAGGPSASG